MRQKRINLCTEAVYIMPEADGGKSGDLRSEYACVTGEWSVRICRHYRPFVGAGGLVCREECKWFEHGCSCPAARKAAHRRTERVLLKMLGA